MASIHLFLFVAVMRHWSFYQLDIKSAFLHGDLQEEVYMEQPLSFVAQGEFNVVYKLKKSLYDLKQSPRAWFERFSTVVQTSGLTRSEIDYSIFYRHSSSLCIYLVIYMDDILITGSDQVGIQKLKEHLHHMANYKPTDTPMDPNIEILSGQGEPFSDPKRYRRLVGKLNYLTVTRLDIVFAVSVVNQFLSSSHDSHWDATIRILRYIKRAPGKGLLYENKVHTTICYYVGAN